MYSSIPPAGQPTVLLQKLHDGEFVTTVEVHPPRGFSLDRTLASLKALMEKVRIDAFNATDVPLAQARMSAITLSVLLQRHTGVEAILHTATRNRNVLALHSDLIGAHALNVRNVYVFRGDNPSIGDYPDASSLSDVTSSQLISALSRLNAGEEVAGHTLSEPASFAIACALSPNAPHADEELASLKRKVDAGAHYIMTQTVFDPEPVRRFHDLLGGFPLPVVLSVLPLQSARHAEFLHNNVPGMVIPEPIRRRLHAAGDNSRAEGAAIARELIEETRGMIAGVYMIPSFGRYDVVAEVLADDPPITGA